jgi:hypothetical protein
MVAIPADASPRRRWRFSLKAILVIQAIVAIGIWGYYDAWPRWQIYRQQMRFEAIAKKIDSRGIVSLDSGRYRLQLREVDFDYRPEFGRDVCTWRFEWPNAIYIVAKPLHPDEPEDHELAATADHSELLRVLRFPIAPAGYRPQTQTARNAIRSWQSMLSEPLPARDSEEAAYRFDVIEFAESDCRLDLDFEYELIHSVRMDREALKDQRNYRLETD